MRTDIAIATDLTPFIVGYPWYEGAGNGFGPKYTNPATLPPSECIAASFSPQGVDITTGSYASPWVLAYPWTLGVGWGPKYNDPGTLPNTSTAVNYSVYTPSGAAVIAVYTNAADRGIIAYTWTTGSGNGFGSPYSNPGTSPGTFVQSVAFSAAPFATSTDMVVSNTGSSPHLTAYPWTDGGGFNTKYSDPGTIPISSLFVAFSPSGADIATVSSFATPYVQVYSWSVGVGWGSKYSDPATLPGSSRGAQFSPNGLDLLIGQSAGGSTPPLGAYPWVTGVGFATKYSDPGTSPPAGAGSFGVAFSRNGGDVVSAYNGGGTPWVVAYSWTTGVGFGPKYPDPATAPGQNANAVMFTPLLKGNLGPLGIFGKLPSPAWLAGLALTKAIIDNPTISRRAMFGAGRGKA